jgi:hypothetical protein
VNNVAFVVTAAGVAIGVAACGSSGTSGPGPLDSGVSCATLGDCPDGGTPADDGGGGGDAAGIPTVGAFVSPPVSWALPNEYPVDGFTDFVGGPGCSGSGPAAGSYFVVDINNDKKMDMVITNDCMNNTTVGIDHWDVYLGSGTGFSSKVTHWSLPAAPAGSSFQALSDSLNALYSPGVVLTDFSGDGQLDLVLVPVGSGSLVYKGEPTGFSSTGVALDYPSAVTSSSSTSTFLYDISGDGTPDLVVYDDGTESSGVGTGHWLVYLGTGKIGFASSATTWSLPSGILKDTFKAGISTVNKSCQGASYFMQDLDGDHRPDLVLTDDCDSSSKLGVSYWGFYAGNGHGFATSPSKWALPAVAPGSFAIGKAFGQSTNGEGMGALQLPVLFSTESDYSGDGRPDLFIANVFGSIGPLAVNNLYVSTGTGFSPAAGAWTTPLTGGDATWFDDTFCDSNGPQFTTADLNLDGIPDIVVTDECGGSSTVGTSKWDVYLGKYE